MFRINHKYYILTFLILNLNSFFTNSSFAQDKIIFHSIAEAKNFENYTRGMHQPLNFFLLADKDLDLGELKSFQKKYKTHLTKLQEKKNENDRRFMRRIFFSTQNNFLKEYQKLVKLSDVFRKGKYDCVTGTALYANILKDLGIQYKIVEMEFHVFLIAELNNKEYLFESTDKNGIITNPKHIRKMIKKYQETETSFQNIKVTASQTSEKGAFQKYIDMNKLIGLQYFNLAVKAFRENKNDDAWKEIKKASLLYPCLRMQRMENAILNYL